MYMAIRNIKQLCTEWYRQIEYQIETLGMYKGSRNVSMVDTIRANGHVTTMLDVFDQGQAAKLPSVILHFSYIVYNLSNPLSQMQRLLSTINNFSVNASHVVWHNTKNNACQRVQSNICSFNASTQMHCYMYLPTWLHLQLLTCLQPGIKLVFQLFLLITELQCLILQFST